MGQSVRVNGVDQTDTLDITIRKTYAQTKALFIVVKNLQVEVQQLRADSAKLRSVVLALLSDPQGQHELEAIARELRIQTYKK